MPPLLYNTMFFEVDLFDRQVTRNAHHLTDEWNRYEVNVTEEGQASINNFRCFCNNSI